MTKPAYKLFVRKVLSREKAIGTNGQEVILLKTIKEEVPMINLGSLKNPNKDIIEFDFVPIEDDEHKTEPSPYDMFRKFFGEQ